jgi:LIVCS family branched-chain amino acid:cation transporter
MRQLQKLLIYGFAIFSMFFGSGNLVFPLKIGQESGGSWQIGFLGLFLTGILLPFLGLFAIKLHKGSYEAFFSQVGEVLGKIITLFTLSLLGSFGVVPRCITVAHAGVSYVYPEFSLTLFSALFSLLCFIFCIKDNFMIAVLGKWITPILLACLAWLIICGVGHAEAGVLSLKSEATEIFLSSFLTGYQTMDLIAAFFFSSLIFKQMQQDCVDEGGDDQMIRKALYPSILGAFLLALVYAGFVYLGAHYAEITANVANEFILPTIASHVLGAGASKLIAVIIIFSCLTTAIALNNIYARYLSSLFNGGGRLFLLFLSLTTTVSFLISLLDFYGIAKFLAPVLELSYPGLIILTCYSMIPNFEYKARGAKILFYGATLLAILAKYYGY